MKLFYYLFPNTIIILPRVKITEQSNKRFVFSFSWIIKNFQKSN